MNMFDQNKVFLKTIALTLFFTSSINAFDFKCITSLFSKNFQSKSLYSKLSSFIPKRPKTVVAFSAIALLSIAGFIWYELGNKKSGPDEVNFVNAYKNNDIENVMRLLKEIDIDKAKALINKAGNKCDFTSWWCNEVITQKMAEFLIFLNDDINKEYENNYNSIHSTYNYNKLEIVKTFLNHKHIGINTEDEDGRSMLYFACEKGYLKIVRELLKHKDTDVNKVDRYGRTPLYLACDGIVYGVDRHGIRNENINYLEIVKELLKHKDIDVNKADTSISLKGKFPLLVAFENGSTGIVIELLKHKDININKTNTCGESTLDLVCKKYWHPFTATLLLENGAYIKPENLINLENEEALKYLNLANQFDLWIQSGSFFDVPEDEKNNVDLCEFKNRLLTSKRAEDKLKNLKILKNTRGLSRFSDCKINLSCYL
ncbi:MAG: hypothetical protein UR12_C0030G0012 [candidate division TM6 bacterium GW2011_GWF2_30_66]|nr:MAG: hypothetical protein UR12_C0030G0012 [candidate division TM6 bacterium GW2011_GWF2_30_66]